MSFLPPISAATVFLVEVLEAEVSQARMFVGPSSKRPVVFAI